MHRSRLSASDMNAQLQDAVVENDTVEVQRLLEQFHNTFFPEALGSSLCKAIEVGNKEIVILLLKFRADIRHVSLDGKRAIHYAAISGSLEMMKIVLEAGSPTSIADTAGKTAMHYAVEAGNKPVVQYLLQKGTLFSRSRCYVEGETPLHIAARLGHTDICRVLVSQRINLNLKTRKEATALHLAVKGKSYGIISSLLEAGACLEEANEKGQTCLLMAVENSSLELMRLLINFGANPNARDMRGRTCMHYIAMSMAHDSHLEMAKFLIASGMDETNTEDVDRYTPLHYAAFKGNLLLVHLLLETGVDINKYYVWRLDTPLNMAISNRQVDMVNLLVEAGIDVTMVDGPLTRQTPLHKLMVTRYPRIEDKLSVAETLINHGAKLNVRTAREHTPLEDCVFYSAVIRDSSLPILMKLVSAGAKLSHPAHARVDPKNSPLCWLTWHGNLQAAKFLVSIGWNLQNESWVWLPGKDEEAGRFLIWLQDLVRKPQSLRQICRSKLRDYLVDFCSNDADITPYVARLPLPVIIKKFLLLKPEIEEYCDIPINFHIN